MDTNKANSIAICVKNLNESDKLPKRMIARNLLEEKDHGITDLNVAIIRDFACDRYAYFKINGEYSGQFSHAIIFVFLIYNRNDELMEASFEEKTRTGHVSNKAFSQTVRVPIDEYITRVLVRIIRDPVFL